MLTSEEAAARLGVKVTTLYVYVSRGLLTSHRTGDGRRSLFDVRDVEALARRSRGSRGSESRMAVVTTSLTQLLADGPHYRGTSAVELARDAQLEDVAGLLWRSGELDWSPVELPADAPADLHARMPWAVVLCGAADPLRSDLRQEAVTRAGARLVATLASLSGDPDGGGTIAQRVARGWQADATRPEGLDEVVRSAMVLLADHELATSTVAVRVAASTRADSYDAVLSGLGTLAGPLHGSAAPRVAALFEAARTRGAATALDEVLRWHSPTGPVIAGFGHGAYPDGDPRCVALLATLRATVGDDAMATVDEVLELARSAGLPEPNVDVGLAAISSATGVDPSRLALLFAVGRTVGWIAHHLEELDEDPLRFRARAVYATGPG